MAALYLYPLLRRQVRFSSHSRDQSILERKEEIESFSAQLGRMAAHLALSRSVLGATFGSCARFPDLQGPCITDNACIAYSVPGCGICRLSAMRDGLRLLGPPSFRTMRIRIAHLDSRPKPLGAAMSPCLIACGAQGGVFRHLPVPGALRMRGNVGPKAKAPAACGWRGLY